MSKVTRRDFVKTVGAGAATLATAGAAPDRARAETFAKAVEAGTIFMNRCDYLDPALPWSGVKSSGKGSSLSCYGLLAMTRPKAIHFRTHF